MKRIGGGEKLLNDFLQSLGDNGLPEKSLSLEAQKYIDDKDVHSIPDGLISCNYAFKIYIESKLSEDINRDQLENHYITKHATRPDGTRGVVPWAMRSLPLQGALIKVFAMRD